MYTIENYVYDPNRLIFYQSDLDNDVRNEIFAYFEKNDHFEILHEKLRAYNANDIQFKPGALQRAGICLTNNCNFRCNYCSEASIDGHEESLSTEDVMIFVRDAMKRWTINKVLGRAKESLRLILTGGGEPTYNWDLFTESTIQIRKECLKNNIPLNLSVTTNGLLDTEKQGFISKNYDSVMVSYDGLPEIQKKNRRCIHENDTSTSVENTILSFINENLRITIRTTIWQSDFYHLKSMADFVFEKFGTSIEWSILPVIPTGRALSRVQKEHVELGKSDFLSPYLNMIDYATKKYGHVNITTPIFQETVETFYCGAISIFCSCPWLLPNKMIISCIESRDAKTIIGKVEKNGVVYSEKVDDPLLEAYQEKFSECRDCIAYRFCKGGCPVRHIMNRNARTTMDDWECTMIRQYWIYVFSNIIKGKECFGWHAISIKIGDAEVLKLANVFDIESP